MRIVTLNCENLFISSSEENPPERVIPFSMLKSKKKIIGLAKALLKIDGDIVFLSEVGKEESLKEFSEKFLDSKYNYSIIEGNSNRGIEIAYLIKKELPYTFQHLTHRNRELELKIPPLKGPFRMSRDIAELRILDGPEDTDPILILLGVHLKSKRDDEGHDWQGQKRRKAEVELLTQTYRILNKRYSKKVPILAMGDFNGLAQKDKHDEEFQGIYRDTSWQDILELIDWPLEKRITFVSFDRNYEAQQMQLDYIFLPSQLHQKFKPKNSGIYQYTDDSGIPFKIPCGPSYKGLLPSDHWPVVCELDL
jgi:exonuclease III